MSQFEFQGDGYEELEHQFLGGSLVSFREPKPLRPGDAAAVGLDAFQQVPRNWLRIDKDGRAHSVKVDRLSLADKLNIPYRDLRNVDPTAPIPYPSSIFIREKAIVCNLETIRLIIARDEVYITSVPQPHSAEHWANPDESNPLVRDMMHRVTGAIGSSALGVATSHTERGMPYELCALEAALHGVVRLLELNVGNLERYAFPALDRLIHTVGRQELDDMRALKTVLSHLLSRIGRIKCELEEILDDDQDMLDMYIGRRADEVAACQGDLECIDRLTHNPDGGLAHDHSIRGRTAEGEDPDGAADDAKRPGNDPRSQQGNRRVFQAVNPHDIEDCEALLESYFMQVEFLYSRLVQLRERIADAEGQIEIELDRRRNSLVAVNLVVGCAGASFAFSGMVAGIFGQNLAPLPITATEHAFFAATFGSLAAAVAIFVATMYFCRAKRLLFIPSTT